ncbi:MAG TPA: hypothetical protein VMV66_01135 [Candidatus Humimicrobiaceae bacterium]|nr:hypothetical protein [Candidatus Humimicrobiaceae bacterium]
MKNIFILIILFYLTVLLQTSFSPHFPIGHLLNFVLVLVIIINLFEAGEGKLGLFGAFFGGFFLDIFSEIFLGFWVIILLTIAVFIKFVLRKYVRLPTFIQV